MGWGKKGQQIASRFDPDKHHRRSIRRAGWDYASAGIYFVTICSYERENLFVDESLRALAENAWQNIPTLPHAVHTRLDEWVVMPNHLHGILILEGQGEAKRPMVSEKMPASGGPVSSLPKGVESGSIGAIIGNVKSRVTRQVNNVRRTPGQKVWQRGYYDRIIRDESELAAIRQYIRDNPHRWDEDRENLDVLIAEMQWHDG